MAQTFVGSPAQAVGSTGAQAILQAGAFSMQTSQLAAERARSAGIRNFAQLEAEEQANVAAALGATPGSVPLRPDDAAKLQELSGLNGSRFDAMYLRGQVAGHEELLALNEAAARGGATGQDRAVSLVAVPAIKTHLYLLQTLRGRG